MRIFPASGSPGRLLVLTVSALLLMVTFPDLAAAAHFTISKASSQTGDGETIVIYAGTSTGWAGCDLPEPRCSAVVTTVRVTPCPPGQSCPDGYYEFTIDGWWATQRLLLDFSTSYQFTGTWQNDVGPEVDGECQYSCTVQEAVAPKNWTTGPPPFSGHWEITVDEQINNTLWVTANLADVDLDANPCGSGCPAHWCIITADPLPLQPTAGWAGNSLLVHESVQLGLDPGVTYMFGGQFDIECFSRSMGSSTCDTYSGSYVQVLIPTEFHANPVSVERTTWGRIKGLYQE